MLRLRRTVGQAIIFMVDGRQARLTLVDIVDVEQAVLTWSSGAEIRIRALVEGSRDTFSIGLEPVEVVVGELRGRTAVLRIGAPRRVQILREELMKPYGVSGIDNTNRIAQAISSSWTCMSNPIQMQRIC